LDQQIRDLEIIN
jgi:hypothetical protein